MISKLYSAVTIVSLSILASCAGNNDKNYVDKTIMPTGTDSLSGQTAAPGTIAPNQAGLPGNPLLNPGAVTPISLNQTPQNISLTPQGGVPVTPPGMNPPHGQPGHRCDIADGAPLNSKPAAPVTAQPAATTQPAVTMTEVTNTQKTAPGMNPPHGEAGHRCDIAVGAPLNSKPPAPVSAVSTTPPPATTITASEPTAQKIVTAPGMNPPHGEAGHRCDIEVGKPLNSKPVAATKEATPPPLLIAPQAKSGGK